MLTKEYIVLGIFILANLALPFYRMAAICHVIVYIVSFAILYISFLFYRHLGYMAIIIYSIASLFFIVRRNVYFLYIIFVNLFICYIIIGGTLYGHSISNFYILFPPEVYDYVNILNMIYDTTDAVSFFGIIGCIFFIIVKSVNFIKR